MRRPACCCCLASLAYISPNSALHVLAAAEAEAAEDSGDAAEAGPETVIFHDLSFTSRTFMRHVTAVKRAWVEPLLPRCAPRRHRPALWHARA